MEETPQALEPVSMPQPTLSPEERRRIGQERGRATVKAAIALKRQVDSEEVQAAEIRAIAREAMPRVLKNMVAIATGTGKHSQASRSAQVAAARLVTDIAAVVIDGSQAPDGSQLAEMTLEQLESGLSGALDRLRSLRALEGQAHAIEDTEETLPP